MDARWNFLLLALGLLSLAGCYSNPAYQREIAILRGEIIDLEDKYYSIKSQYESAQIEIQSLRGNPPNAQGNGNSEEIFGQPRNGNEPLPNQEDNDPIIEDGEGGDGENDMGGNDGYLTGPENRNFESASIPQKSDPAAWVRDIQIDRELSRAQNFDGKAGDDGILLVVQPVDDAGNVIPVAGKIKVSIIDKHEKGERQRIGFYELLEQDVQPIIETSEALGAGIHLRLNWNRHVPRNRLVRVFVRYEVEGRRYQASIPIRVNTTADQQANWTPDRMSPTAAQSSSNNNRPTWRPRR